MNLRVLGAVLLVVANSLLLGSILGSFGDVTSLFMTGGSLVLNFAAITCFMKAMGKPGEQSGEQ